MACRGAIGGTAPRVVADQQFAYGIDPYVHIVAAAASAPRKRRVRVKYVCGSHARLARAFRASKRVLDEHDTVRRHAQAGNRSEEHTSGLQSLMRTSYAVFCLTNKKLTPSCTKLRPAT